MQNNPDGNHSPVIRLRDMVCGMAWLLRQPRPLQPSPTQLHRIWPLLPAIRHNFEGPPGLIDPILEKQVWQILNPAQQEAARKFLAASVSPPDCQAALRTLEQEAAR